MSAEFEYPSEAEIEAIIAEQVEDMMEELTVQVMRIAEEALAIARTQHLYKVQTNNLASSTGFAVTRDGHDVVISDFTPAAGHPGGDEGCKKGAEYLRVVMKPDSGLGNITLAMVAGMDYAAAVEDMGLDVLRSAERHIEIEIEKLMSAYS